MLPDARTLEGKVVLYACATGERFERWPVDARDMLRSGAYTADPSKCEVPALAPPATVAPAAEVSPIPTEYAPGVPLVVTHAHNAPPAQPFAGGTRRGKK